MWKSTFAARAFLALVFVGFLVGCATTPERTSGPEACVVVDNTEGSGTQSRIFLVSSTSGWRLGMGEVGMGRTLEYCTRRVTIPERVSIVVERPATGGRSSMSRTRTRGIRSPEFVLRLDEVWTWDLVLNQLTRSIVVR